MNEQQIADLLAKRFPLPQWTFLRGVRNATGFPATLRTADALAMSMWPSRGLELHGFEIKSARQDWLNELKHPEKAEEICRFCDRWWIVADEKVVEANEVPDGWGWMVVRKDRLRMAKEAPGLASQPPTRAFLASVLKSAVGQISPEAQRKEAYDRGLLEGLERGEKRAIQDEKYRRDKIERWEKVAEDFYKKAGVYISEYSNGTDLGEAVRMVMSGDHLKIDRRLRDLLERSQAIVRDIEARLKTGEVIIEA